jgi:hypothetical protein
MLDTLFTTMDRQGLLKGDLNVLQRTGLIWLMGQEIKEQAELERIRMETNALASNQHTSTEFLKQIFKEREEEAPQEEEWITPTSAEDLEDLLNQFT